MNVNLDISPSIPLRRGSADSEALADDDSCCHELKVSPSNNRREIQSLNKLLLQFRNDCFVYHDHDDDHDDDAGQRDDEDRHTANHPHRSLHDVVQSRFDKIFESCTSDIMFNASPKPKPKPKISIPVLHPQQKKKMKRKNKISCINNYSNNRSGQLLRKTRSCPMNLGSIASCNIVSINRSCHSMGSPLYTIEEYVQWNFDE
jgi:hypothetical protein